MLNLPTKVKMASAGILRYSKYAAKAMLAYIKG